MNWLEKQLNNCATPDLVLHIGSGPCRELPHWLQSEAKSIVLVEANPEILAELRRRVHGQPKVTIVPAAIAEQGGRGSFRLFNFPLLSSLREPTGLYQSLPGLRQIARATVELMTMPQLLDKLGVDDSTSNWLVIDTPGEEGTIIEQLQKSDRLHHFARIFLSAGSERLYQDAKSATELISSLQSEGYETIGQTDHSDADWPRHHLRLDRMTLECKRLKADLDDVHKRLAATRTSGELQVHELEEKLAEKTSHAAKLEEKLAEKTSHDAKLQEEYKQLQAKLSNAEETCKTTLQHQRRIAELEDVLAERNSKIEKLQADLSLALRLQMLRENDLEDLQTRYAELLTIKEQQQDLLTQLHHRLSRAAEYLQMVHAQPDEQQLPDELLEALTGKDSKPD